MEYLIGLDIGGTATDCVVMDQKGNLTVGKAFSTPPTFVEGVIDALDVASKKLGTTFPDLLRNTSFFMHSSTVADNMIASGTLSKAGMLVTRGCEDILLLTRGPYGRWSGLTEEEIKNPLETNKPPSLIPVTLIKGIKERTDVHGKVLAEPHKDEVRAAVEDLVQRGAQALGVCFLSAFANSHNENIVKQICSQSYPDIYLTLSSELAPTLGEYERISTVALNVSLGPVASQYLAGLDAALKDHRFKGALLIMQGHGGLLTADRAHRQPVGLIESGPVGGLVGSRFLGAILGYGNIVAADLGGTTFKVGVIREGRIEYQREPMALRYHYALPKMDVNSIGLAGGSIIWLDPRTKAPRIGPRSAGARPGPVCYGFGGKEPTITDVDLILGYLAPHFFLGGRARLDYEPALSAFKEQIAEPLGIDIFEAAASVYRLANSFMYDLLHKMTVQKGLSPRDYVLFSYGGTAGMHLGIVAQELQFRHVVIPYTASVQGAFGLISADLVHEYQTTKPTTLPVEVDVINAILENLSQKTISQLRTEGFDENTVVLHRSIDMRYRHQVHEITTPLDANPGSSTVAPLKSQGRLADLGEVCSRFERLYEQRYGKGSGHSEGGIEMVTFRARGVGLLEKPRLGRYPAADADASAAFLETRDIYIVSKDFNGRIEARGFDFEKLLPGNRITGPAIIWSPITTIVVSPGQVAEVDGYKNILVRW